MAFSSVVKFAPVCPPSAHATFTNQGESFTPGSLMRSVNVTVVFTSTRGSTFIESTLGGTFEIVACAVAVLVPPKPSLTFTCTVKMPFCGHVNVVFCSMNGEQSRGTCGVLTRGL